LLLLYLHFLLIFFRNKQAALGLYSNTASTTASSGVYKALKVLLLALTTAKQHLKASLSYLRRISTTLLS
jgi:hypothetical protein